MEKTFLGHYERGNVSHFRLCCLVSVLMLALWISLDRSLSFTDLPPVFLQLRIVLILAFALGFAFSFLVFLSRIRQILTFLYVLMVGMSLSLMLLLSPEAYFYPLLFAQIIVLTFNYSFVRMRFIYALSSAVILFPLMAVVLLGRIEELGPYRILTGLCALSVFHVLGLIISYTTEHSYRREYYLRQCLEEEKKNQIAMMGEKLYRDELTGLYNRYAVFELLGKKMEDAVQHKRSCALAYFDLDRLKHVNDNFGHGMGDRYLQLLAEALASHTSQGDMAARLGGDEFLIYLEDCAAPERVIGKIRADYRRLCREELNGIAGEFSCGIMSECYKKESLKEMIFEADKRMLINKRKRRMVRESRPD